MQSKIKINNFDIDIDHTNAMFSQDNALQYLNIASLSSFQICITELNLYI